jgi:hypothetical protein
VSHGVEGKEREALKAIVAGLASSESSSELFVWIAGL